MDAKGADVVVGPRDDAVGGIHAQAARQRGGVIPNRVLQGRDLVSEGGALGGGFRQRTGDGGRQRSHGQVGDGAVGRAALAGDHHVIRARIGTEHGIEKEHVTGGAHEIRAVPLPLVGNWRRALHSHLEGCRCAANRIRVGGLQRTRINRDVQVSDGAVGGAALAGRNDVVGADIGIERIVDDEGAGGGTREIGAIKIPLVSDGCRSEQRDREGGGLPADDVGVMRLQDDGVHTDD